MQVNLFSSFNEEGSQSINAQYELGGLVGQLSSVVW